MEQTLAVIGTLLVVYVFFHCLEFLWNLLIKAPVAITNSMTAKIGNMQVELSRKRPIDEFKEKDVSRWLEKWSEKEKKFLVWLLHQGETVDYRFRDCGLPQAIIDEALGKGRRCGLIKDHIDLRGGVPSTSFINPNYVDALTNLLHPW